MEEHFRLLSKLQSVQVPKDLYSAINRKIRDQNQGLSWIRYAAAIMVVLIAVDVYVFLSNTEVNRQEPSEILYISNNYLYHD